jgi:hypothetical protein
VLLHFLVVVVQRKYGFSFAVVGIIRGIGVFGFYVQHVGCFSHLFFYIYKGLIKIKNVEC